MNLKKLADRAKSVVEKRGGTDALKEDTAELQDIAKGKGSLSDKAKDAADALKDPGEKGPESPGAEGPRKQGNGRRSGAGTPEAPTAGPPETSQ